MTTETARASTSSPVELNDSLEVALPETDASMRQDAEWCVVRVEEDEWRRVQFHDYRELFSIPGLYEKVIYDILRCDSPRVVTDLLTEAVRRNDGRMSELRVLDLGAGNGMVGELLAARHTGRLVGVDIIEEAAEATERDRPGVYENYHVVDLANLNESERRELRSYRFNCLTCVAALGFGDIPTEVFTAAFDLIEPDGWVAFNIKEEFLERQDASGFAELIRTMTRDGVLDVRSRRRYQHRLGVDRTPIQYVAFVGRKRRHITQKADHC